MAAVKLKACKWIMLAPFDPNKKIIVYVVILWFLFSRIFESENKSIENKKESRWFFLGAHPFPGN